jgi:hypothetical protein
VTVICAGGTVRSLCIARGTLRRYWEWGLMPDVRSDLKKDPATRWVMEEAEREADP